MPLQFPWFVYILFPWKQFLSLSKIRVLERFLALFFVKNKKTHRTLHFGGLGTILGVSEMLREQYIDPPLHAILSKRKILEASENLLVICIFIVATLFKFFPEMGSKSKKNYSRRPKAKFKGKPSWKKPKAQQHSVPLAPRGESEQPFSSCENLEDRNSSMPAQDQPETPKRASFEPSKSAAARKLGTDSDCCAEDGSGSFCPSRVSASNSPYFQQPEPEGNIVSLKNLKAAMELMHKCKGGQILLVDDYSKRHGLCNSMYFECTLCKHRVYLKTSEKAGAVADVNRRAAFAASEVGLGREGLAVICEIMSLPQPVSDSNFQDHNKAIHDATIKCVNSNMQEAAYELRKKIMEENPEMSEESIMDITVSFDGTWSKRGFTANFGVGFVIAAETGKVIDFVTLSKVCEMCKQGNKLQKDKQNYEQ